MTTHFNYLPRSLTDELNQIATMLMTPGHGILITDESPLQLEKQLEIFGINCTEEMRTQYRNMLFSAKETMANYVSGVAVHPEVLDQTTSNGCALHCQLRRKNILVGVTVDRGLVPMSCSLGEFTTQGLDGLAAKCAEYKDCGCDFTMWRVQYNIGEFTPSYQAIIENANTLGKYAAISQSKRMLPILEVDIVPSEDNDLDRAEKVGETILMYIYKALYDHHVNLQGTLLKVLVLNSGPKCEKRCSPGQISKATLRLLRQIVPAAVGGIIFQVDGKTEDKALCQLNAVAVDPSPKPWPVGFSFDGAMQASIFIAWAGQTKNADKAQQELLKMLGAFSQAVLGTYAPGSMKSLADQCYCKKTLKALKTKPAPLPDDCVKFDEICRPPNTLIMAAKAEKLDKSEEPSAENETLPIAEVKEQVEGEIEIGALKQLEELNISKNHLQRLPIQLSECQRLRELNLSDNVNIWHIPERISNLPSLQSLSADRCALIYLPVALSKFLNHVRIFHNTSITHVPMIYEKFFQTFYDNRSKATPMAVSHETFFWVLEKETNTKLLLPFGTRRIFCVPSIDNQVTLYDDCLRAVQYLARFMPLWENVALKKMLPEKFIHDHILYGPTARCTLFNCSNPLYTSYYFMAVKRRGSTSKQIFTCYFCSNRCANLWLVDNGKKYYQLEWEICDA